MKLFGYRVLENDEDGDPVNHGLIVAEDQAACEKIIESILLESLGPTAHQTRIYDHGDVEAAYRLTSGGFVECHGYVDVLIDPDVVHMDVGKELVCQAETEHATWSTDPRKVTCPDCRSIMMASDHPPTDVHLATCDECKPV